MDHNGSITTIPEQAYHTSTRLRMRMISVDLISSVPIRLFAATLPFRLSHHCGPVRLFIRTMVYYLLLPSHDPQMLPLARSV